MGNIVFKLVYVSSPYRAIYDSLAQNHNLSHDKVMENAYCIATALAQKGIDWVKNRNDETQIFLPISPIFVLERIYARYNPFALKAEEPEIMRACFELLGRCDEVLVVDSPYTHKSSGIQAEINKANELGIPVLYELGEVKSVPDCRRGGYEEWLIKNGFKNTLKD